MTVLKKISIFQFLLIFSLAFGSIYSFASESLILFHAGKRVNLMDDIQQKGISPKIWNQFIFGKTNFDLPDYRKGLYGAEAFADTSLYSTNELYAGQEPWVMVIKIKPNCMISPNLYNLDFSINPNRASLFSNWLKNKLDHADSISQQKIKKDINECSHDFTWDEGIHFNMHKHSEAEQKITLQCTSYLNDFLNETRIKIVEDTVNGEHGGNWYIRDRNCIESISGSPDELLQMIGKNSVGNKEEFLYLNFLGSAGEPGYFPIGNVYIFLRILAETTLLNSKNTRLLNKIEIAMIDPAHNNSLSENQKIENNELAQFFETQEFSIHSHADLFVSIAVRAANQAIKNNKVKDFQIQLTELLNQLRTQFGESCQNIKNENQDQNQEKNKNCEQSSLIHGQKLLNFFINILQLKL